MKFGPVPLEEARGAIMAHSQRVGERMIRKGSVLDEGAVSRCARQAVRTSSSPGWNRATSRRISRPTASPSRWCRRC